MSSLEPFRFLHTGDLHLDSPVEGLSAEAPPEVLALLRAATTDAWRGVVEAAIGHRVDFVVIAGDVFEVASPTLLGQTRFRDGLARLADAGIANFVVHGNHDPLDGRSWAPSLASRPPFRIRSLEAADELGALRQELAGLEGQAAALATEWAVRAVTGRLLTETRSRYERERQPDVVRAATSHFSRFTGGRYSRIVAPPGEAGVRVETEAGEGRGTAELSRGTAEQLYLALRFGLIEEFARHAEPLPVVMDDTFVNFDAGRASAAAEAVRDLATRHQVIYFTCHARTAELLDPEGARTVALA